MPKYSVKPVNEIQSLSRKPVNHDKKQYTLFAVLHSITLAGKFVKHKFSWLFSPKFTKNWKNEAFFKLFSSYSLEYSHGQNHYINGQFPCWNRVITQQNNQKEGDKSIHLSHITQNENSGQILLICPEFSSDYKGERAGKAVKQSPRKLDKEWDKLMFLSRRDEMERPVRKDWLASQPKRKARRALQTTQRFHPADESVEINNEHPSFG